MKLHIEQQDLLRHINIAQRAISSRTTMPILEGIRFEAKDGKLVLTSTDLELSIETTVPCTVEEEGGIVLNANIIGNIARKLPTQTVTMTTEQDKVHIDCVDSHFHLQGGNASEYPSLPEVETDQATLIYGNIIKRAGRETQFATSADETKVALTGILFERTKGEARFVALDGYRLAVKSVPLGEDSADVNEEVIVPRRAFEELPKIASDESLMKIRTVPGHIVFESENTKMYSRLIEKKYINYREIISKDFKTTVKLNRLDFQNALERASLLAKEERANLIKLYFEGDVLHIESNSEIGNVNETLHIATKGDELKIAFNAKYLLDGVKALDCEEITLELNGALNPLVMRPVAEEKDYLYLVLPVRVGRE